jgi:hypothetical protein
MGLHQGRRGASGGILLVIALIASVASARDPGWIALESAEFRAYSQVSERKARQILRQLQVFEGALAKVANFRHAAPPVASRIFLLDQGSFQRATPGMGDVAGVFIVRPFGNDIVIDASQPTDLSLFTIYHEYVHFNVRNRGDATLPAFYEEGLAQFLQYFRVRGRNYEFGYFPQEWAEHARSSAMPLERVLAVEVGSEEYSGHTFQAPFYARSLLLLHYCLLGTGQCQDQLLQFVTRRANGEDIATAFAAEFGKTPQEFDRELDKYVRSAPGRSAQWPTGSLRDPPDPVTREISGADADVQFASLLLRGKALDGLDALLNPKLAQGPDDPAALAVLAQWHELSGRPAEADAIVRRLLASPASSAADLTAVGTVLLSRVRERNDQGKAVVRDARKLFQQALERDPASLEAAFGYGLTQAMVPDDLEPSLRIVAAAARRFPRSGELQFVHAAHLGMMGRDEEAKLLLHAAACRVIDPRIRALVRRELGSERVTCAKAR